MITKIDPADFDRTSTVQVDSDAANPFDAVDEIQRWATEHGFVRTNEYHPRQVLINGQRHFRSVCFRLSAEEIEAIEMAQRHMVERGEHLRGMVPKMAGAAR